MLRKRTRSHQKSQQKMGQTHHLIVDSCSTVINPKISESDSVRSPTSPLDFKFLSKPNFVNFPVRVCSKPNEVIQKSWNCNKVGLSMIESFKDETKPSSGKILRSSDSKSVLFGPQIRIFNNPNLNRVGFESLSNSLPKNYPIFPHSHKSNPKLINSYAQEPFAKFESHSLDSANNGSDTTRLTTREANSNPGRDLVASLSASEIELSEDYTCVRKHGPNPKTTHIFGDCILERHDNEFIAKSFEVKEHEIKPLEVVMNSYPSDDFLSFCYFCKKKLEGEDIYMYRGEKAFCSWNCRSEEILIEEEMEKNISDTRSYSQTAIMHKPDICEELPETSMFIAA